jgi:hypothetical protein
MDPAIAIDPTIWDKVQRRMQERADPDRRLLIEPYTHG